MRPDTTTPGLKEAKEKLNYLQMNSDERRAYEHYLDNLRIEEDCLESAKLEGLAEGRAEGRAEGKTEAMKEMAKSLKELNVPIEIIIKTTDLSANEIESL